VVEIVDSFIVSKLTYRECDGIVIFLCPSSADFVAIVG